LRGVASVVTLNAMLKADAYLSVYFNDNDKTFAAKDISEFCEGMLRSELNGRNRVRMLQVWHF
jgi:hypothetical protein